MDGQADPYRQRDVTPVLPPRGAKSRGGSRQEVTFSWRAKRASPRGCPVEHKAQPGEDRWFCLPGVLGQDKERELKAGSQKPLNTRLRSSGFTQPALGSQ